jgi:Domain of unknown function (DUF222)
METTVGDQAGGAGETPTHPTSDHDRGGDATGGDDGERRRGAGPDGMGPAETWRCTVVSQELVDSMSRIGELSDAELIDVLIADRAAEAQHEAAWLSLIRELDSRGIAARLGATSTAAFLSHRWPIDPDQAARDVLAARRLDPAGDQPPQPGASSRPPPDMVLVATGRDLAAGVLSRAHADVIADIVLALPRPGAGGQPTDRLPERPGGTVLPTVAR